MPLVLADGRVVVGALDLAEDRFNYEGAHEGQGGPPPEGRWRVVTWASRDGGTTFGPPSVVADDLVIPQRIVPDLGPTPGFASDAGGQRLYAVWDAGRGDGRDVFLASSSDGGTEWSPARRVLPRPGTQTLPAVAVDPGGRLDILFYDRSRDRQDAMTEVVLASSWDGGRSFAALTVSDRPFDSRIGLGSIQGIPLLGMQLALHSAPRRAFAFWSDTRQGSHATNIQDLAFADVEVRATAGRRLPFVVLGGGLLALAALVIVLPAVRRTPAAARRSSG